MIKKFFRALPLLLSLLMIPGKTWASELETPMLLKALSLTNPLMASTLLEMSAFEDQELHSVFEKKHATRIRLQIDSENHILKSAPSVILVHGMYKSPENLASIEEFCFSLGAHVINIRLPDHHEKIIAALDHTNSKRWFDQVQRAVRWGALLGSDVTLIGHSVGGMLSFGVAAENVESIQHLILLAPALRLNSMNTLLTKLSYLGIQGTFSGEDYISTWAGRQIMALQNRISHWPLIGNPKLKDKNRLYERQIESLQKMDILWLDTESDDSINLSLNTEVAQRIESINPLFRRHLFLIGEAVAHEDLPEFNAKTEPILKPALIKILHPQDSY